MYDLIIRHATVVDGIWSHGKPHPRIYGTYPRILGIYVREERLLSLEEAVRKMTSFPAQKFGLWQKGLVREGMNADLVVFDPNTIAESASFQDPHQYPTGLPYVITKWPGSGRSGPVYRGTGGPGSQKAGVASSLEAALSSSGDVNLHGAGGHAPDDNRGGRP